MKYRLVSLFSILFGVFLLIVVAAARFAFFISTISFETNGAAPIQSVEIEAGDTLDLPSPTREGYTFGGWFLDSEYERSANVLVLNNQDRTLYAYWLPNLYTVTFDSNGGSDVDAVTQTFDSEFLAPTQPTLEGYDFAGWFTDDETFLQSFTFGTHPLDTNLFAKWTATVYDITYQLDGGILAEGSTLSYTVEDDLVVFNDPTKTGYTFEGWFDNNAFDGDVYVAINPNLMSDLTLFAKFTVNQYTISFDEAGGTNVTSITQDFGTTVTKPMDPTRVGHTFQGWLLEGQAFVFTTMPVNGANLVASWQINSYAVTLNVDGGDALTTSSFDVEYDSSLTLVTPTRTGYQFNGWSDGTEIWTTGDEMPANALSLTAQWSLINYSIVYVMDRGFNNDANPATYTFLTPTITLLDPDKEGHTFNGWFTDAAFTQPSTTIAQGSTGEKTFYAKWTINTYTITLDVNNGDPLAQTVFTYNFAATLALPTPTRLGYDFDGWETAEEVRYGNGNIMPAQDLVLVAQWDQKIYQVVYYTFKADVTDSNKLPAVSNYTLGQTVTEQSISNPGYTFDGWFNAADDQPFTFGFNMTDISEPYTLYGKWTPIIYTVTYVLIEEEEETGENEVVENNPANPETFTIEDEPIVLQDPTRDGYTFNGWKSESVTVSTVGGVTTNIVLTAQWLLIRYDITYVLDDGQNNFDNPRNFNVEETYPLLPAVKQGYTFTGWKNQNNQTITEIPLGLSGNLTLTAQWTINKYTFRYRTFEGQAYTTVNNKEYGSTLGMATPTRRGYTFVGWEDNATGASYTASSTMPDNNLDLTGMWNINNYSIDYNLNLGTTAPTPFTYNYTVLQAISIASPTRTGWVFVGWDTADDGTANHTPIAGTTTIAIGTYAEDLNLKAVWTQNIYTLSYNTDGGNSISNKTFTFSQTLDGTYFPTPTKAGETFTGWYDSTGARWGVGGNSNNTGPNNNLALTARWATFPYSITYDAANGENTYTTSVYPGANVYIGFTPYREGYTFVGWKDEDDGTFYTSSSIMPTKNLTLTAQWEAND
jgi:uncharacterized repeat protein (TIGR02543 family)